MTIRTKVIGCLLVVFSLFLGVSIYNFFRLKQANERLLLVNELFLPFSRLTVQLQGNISSVAEEMRRYYFKAEPLPEGVSFARIVRDVYPYLVNKRFNAVERLLSKQELSQVRAIVSDLSQTVARAREKFNQLTQVKDKSEFESVYAELRTLLQNLSRQVDDECQSITLTAQNEGKDSLVASLTLSVFVILFSLLALVLSYQGLQPLPTLISSIKKIADGDFNQSLKVSSSDTSEVAVLAREYNRMLAALNERDKKIQVQQNELVQAERLATVGQLSAEIVHEIRNPLNSISLNIDWLESELESQSSEIKTTLRSISREIERLHQITESYLVRARVPVDEMPKTAVNELIREILEFSREEDRARNITIKAELAKQEFYVRTERARLKQALLNLFKNAREAMPRGGCLSIRTELRDNVYRVQVGDTGYGMNDATRSQTFRPFYTTKPNGTGLGLTLTREIVEEAQGSIHCDSQVGAGTVFTLQFPV